MLHFITVMLLLVWIIMQIFLEIEVCWRFWDPEVENHYSTVSVLLQHTAIWLNVYGFMITRWLLRPQPPCLHENKKDVVAAPFSPVQIAFSKSPAGLCLYFIEPTGPCTTLNKWSWNKSHLYFTVLYSNIWQRKHRDTFGVNYLAVSYLWSPNIFTVVFFFFF